MNSITYDLNERKIVLKNVIDDAGEKIKHSPEGYLKIIGNKFYYCLEGSGETFIASGNFSFAKKLALKEYYMKIMNLAYLEYASLENGRIYSGEKFEDVYGALSPARKALIDNEYIPGHLYTQTN